MESFMKTIMKRLVLAALVIGTGVQAQEVPPVPNQPYAVVTILSNLASATGNILYFGCSSLIAALKPTLEATSLASSGIKTATEYPKTSFVCLLAAGFYTKYYKTQMDKAQETVRVAEQIVNGYLDVDTADANILKKLLHYWKYNARAIKLNSQNVVACLANDSLKDMNREIYYENLQISLQTSLENVDYGLKQLKPYTTAHAEIDSTLFFLDNTVTRLQDLSTGNFDSLNRHITDKYDSRLLNATRIKHLLSGSYNHKAGALYWQLFQIREALYAINTIVEANKEAIVNVQ